MPNLLECYKEGKSKGVSDYDIRELISYINGYNDTSGFFMHSKEQIKDYEAFCRDLSRLEQGIPLAYILGYSLFLGEKYIVNNDVLIPRPETEELVLLALKRKMSCFENKKITLLDLGTGSGCIACEIKRRMNNANVIASDISIKALEVAKKNIENNKFDIKTYHSDALENINVKVDMIVSNPPYIPNVNEADKNVYDNEPHLALFIDGESVYEKVFKNFHKVARYPFVMVFEIDPSLEKPLIELMNKYLSNKYEFSFSFTQDINKKIRFLTIGVVNNEKN